VTIDATVVGKSRDAIVDALLAGDPAISVAAGGEDGIYVNPMTLADGEDEIVLRQLEVILRGE